MSMQFPPRDAACNESCNESPIEWKARVLRARAALVRGSDAAGTWAAALTRRGESVSDLVEVIAYQGVEGCDAARARWAQQPDVQRVLAGTPVEEVVAEWAARPDVARAIAEEALA